MVAEAPAHVRMTLIGFLDKPPSVQLTVLVILALFSKIDFGLILQNDLHFVIFLGDFVEIQVVFFAVYFRGLA